MEIAIVIAVAIVAIAGWEEWLKYKGKTVGVDMRSQLDALEKRIEKMEAGESSGGALEKRVDVLEEIVIAEDDALEKKFQKLEEEIKQPVGK